MKPKTELVDEYDVMEHALHRLIWTEQKKFAQLLEEHHLSMARFLVLLSIHRRGSGCPIGALADEWLQSYPTMTGIVDRLEGAGLVSRQRDPDGDRRQVVVNLTPQGQHLLARALAARRERMVHALSQFTAEERRELLRLLSTYLDGLEKESK